MAAESGGCALESTTQNIVIAAVAIALPTIIPTVAVVISILRSDSKIDSLRADIRGDMRLIEGITYDHHGRITRLESDQGSR